MDEFETTAGHSQKMNSNDKHVQDIIKMMNEDLNLERLENEANEIDGSNFDENFYSDEKSESNTEVNNNNTPLNENINTIEQVPSDSGCSSEMETYKKIESKSQELKDPVTCVNANSCENDVNIEENDDLEDEDETDLEIVEFIQKAKEFEANALDLSKKNLKKVPKQLYELDNLQVRKILNYLKLI